MSVLTILLAAALGAETHPFSVHDMLAMQRLSDPQVSPDLKHVLFEVRTTDVAANKGRTDLWVVDTDGKALRRLTTHEANDGSARWLADSRTFLFLSTRSGSSQVWRMTLDGGEPEQVTRLPLDVDNLKAFPDGKRILVSLEIYPDLKGPTALDETSKRDQAKAASKVQARVYEQLLFRHWDTWEDGKRSHAFVVDLGTGAFKDLMEGFDGDCPVKPFGGSEALAIAPDGAQVAFSARRQGKDAAWTTNLDVFVVPADGSAAPQCVSTDNLAQDEQPVYSPDGSTLAWLAMATPQYEADRQRIVLMDRKTGAKRALTEAWDRSPGGFVWSQDGATLFAAADNVGNKSLFAIDAKTGAVATLVEKGTCDAPAAAGDRVLFLRDDLKSPAELYAVARAGGAPAALTAINAERVKAVRMGDAEQFTFKGWNGEPVYGYALKPCDFDAAKKYPVALLIHGGPQGTFGDHFHYRWNPQAYAGAGFAAVFIDFHGSNGYGQAFCDSIRGDWGGKPYEDLMKGLDFALATYPWMDGARCAALGGSYGGYMVNWIHGQTDRFKALVCHDGNLDERMAYFDTEELWFPEFDHGGTPWEHPEGYAHHNPIDFVAKWKTPTLVIHGANDFRVVDTQGMSTFTALQRRGVPSKLVIFPDENHWVLKPQNSILWHENVIEWITRWTKA